MENPYVDLSQSTKFQKVAQFLMASMLLGFGVDYLVLGILTILETL